MGADPPGAAPRLRGVGVGMARSCLAAAVQPPVSRVCVFACVCHLVRGVFLCAVSLCVPVSPLQGAPCQVLRVGYPSSRCRAPQGQPCFQGEPAGLGLSHATRELHPKPLAWLATNHIAAGAGATGT